jgi:hypothetical protein
MTLSNCGVSSRVRTQRQYDGNFYSNYEGNTRMQLGIPTPLVHYAVPSLSLALSLSLSCLSEAEAQLSLSVSCTDTVATPLRFEFDFHSRPARNRYVFIFRFPSVALPTALFPQAVPRNSRSTRSEQQQPTRVTRRGERQPQRAIRQPVTPPSRCRPTHRHCLPLRYPPPPPPLVPWAQHQRSRPPPLTPAAARL